MIVIMNERLYAESVINGEPFKNHPRSDLPIMAKYYKSLGYHTKQMETELEKLMIERFPKIPRQTVRRWIKRGIDMARKYPLYEINSITVTKAELDQINNVHSKHVKDYRLHRFAFSLLCFSKFFALRGTKDGWINMPWKDLLAAADLKGLSKERRNILIRELCDTGLISVPLLSTKESVQVHFAVDGKPEAVVDDINEAGKIYQELNGKRYIRCQRCGCRVAVTNGRARVCKPCSVIVGREKSRERMRAKREQVTAIGA